MSDIVDMDRYEKRSQELEDNLIKSFEENGSTLDFWARDDVVMTQEIIQTFRKASKTYVKKD